MDFLSDIETYPLDWLGYNSKLYISAYDGSITRQDHNVIFRYSDWFNSYVGVSFRNKYYDYRQKFQYDEWRDVNLGSPVNLWHMQFNINVTPEWSVYIDDYRNMRTGGTFGKTYDQSINLAYTSQCYRIIGRYTYDGYDKSYSVMVELPGLFE